MAVAARQAGRVRNHATISTSRSALRSKTRRPFSSVASSGAPNAPVSLVHDVHSTIVAGPEPSVRSTFCHSAPPSSS